MLPDDGFIKFSHLFTSFLEKSLVPDPEIIDWIFLFIKLSREFFFKIIFWISWIFKKQKTKKKT